MRTLTPLLVVAAVVAMSVGVAAAAVTSSAMGYGPDGRLTVLLVGSDARPGVTGERLDVILVASFDPGSDRVAMASVPRDAVRFPIAASNGGGTSGSQRVNVLYSTYRSTRCADAAERRACALVRFRDDVEGALDVDIDHYVYVRFPAFDALVDEIDGVLVDTPGAIIDKWYMDEPTLPKGIRFPLASDWELRGRSAPSCLSHRSSDPPCHRAIVYVRSRKGTEGTRFNNDYRRSYRQQDVVMAAIAQVTGREDGEDGDLGSLVTAIATHAAEGTFATDMPSGYAEALALYQDLQGARLGPRKVFAPIRFASRSGTAIVLKLSAVRAWVDAKLSPLGPGD